MDKEGYALKVHLLHQEQTQVARTPRHQLVGVLGNGKNGGLLMFPTMELHLFVGGISHLKVNLTTLLKPSLTSPPPQTLFSSL